MRRNERGGVTATATRTRHGPRHLPLRSLYIPEVDARYLLEHQGLALALWRAAEVAALREQMLEPPILDLGCGDGLVTAVTLRGMNVVVGVDPDGNMLEKARQTGAYCRLIAARMEDIDEQELPSKSIGTVISNSVLEHIPQVDVTLAAAARVLCPGGRLIFTVPMPAYSRWLVLPFPRYAAWRNRMLTHRNLESVRSWEKRLARAGFALEAVQPYLRHHLVTLWDALDLAQHIWVGRQVVSLIWRHLPSRLLDALARRLAATNLSAYGASGGRLFVARKAD